MPTSRFEMPEWECMQLLGRETVARLCVVDGHHPIAVPLNYRVVPADAGTTLAFRTSPTSMVGRYEGPASVEIDSVDTDRAWSIIARGQLTLAQRPHDLPDPRPLITEGRDRWLTLRVTEITGRRFVRTPGAEGFAVEWQPADM